MPHKLDISCPYCSKRAVFEFAEIVQIEKRADISFFESSDKFDYQFFEGDSGQRWHGAVYYALLHGGSTLAIGDLPEGYEPSDWEHSKYLTRNRGLDWGAISCRSCGAHQKHTLDWPADAYFSITYKAQQLWAFDRESFVELRDFIQSTEREEGEYRWRGFLLHIPTVFKRQSARETIVKRINKQLLT